VTLQATLLARFAPTHVADAFIASRLGGRHGATFGTLDADLCASHARAIIDRAFGPQS
jgi:putative acyl-CoA dehydrogenase